MKFTKFFVGALVAATMMSCGNGTKKCDSACADSACAAVNVELPIAVQLYSVRGDMEADFVGTLAKVKGMGYDGVEFAGLFGNAPEQVKHWCDSLGLDAVSAHVPLADMLADVDKVIADYKAIGCEYIVVPYVTEERRPNGELFMQMIEEIKAIGEKASAAGLTLLYHNHDSGWAKFGWGKIYGQWIAGATIFCYDMDKFVPANLLQTELDMCWVKYAGYEPVEYLKKYEGRSPVVHLKDYYKEGEMEGDPYALIGLNEGEQKPASAFEFRPLGTGVQNIPSIIVAAQEAGSKWLVVEQDNPSLQKTPLECIQMSIEYLKGLSK